MRQVGYYPYFTDEETWREGSWARSQHQEAEEPDSNQWLSNSRHYPNQTWIPEMGQQQQHHWKLIRNAGSQLYPRSAESEVWGRGAGTLCFHKSHVILIESHWSPRITAPDCTVDSGMPDTLGLLQLISLTHLYCVQSTLPSHFTTINLVVWETFRHVNRRCWGPCGVDPRSPHSK